MASLRSTSHRPSEAEISTQQLGGCLHIAASQSLPHSSAADQGAFYYQRLHYFNREAKFLAQGFEGSDIPLPAPAQGKVGANYKAAHLKIPLEIEDKLSSAECSNFSSESKRNNQINPQTFEKSGSLLESGQAGNLCFRRQHSPGINVKGYHAAEEIALGGSLSQLLYEMSMTQMNAIENPNSKQGFAIRGKG
jgi:hypothetical protein